MYLTGRVNVHRAIEGFQRWFQQKKLLYLVYACFSFIQTVGTISAAFFHPFSLSTVTEGDGSQNNSSMFWRTKVSASFQFSNAEKVKMCLCARWWSDVKYSIFPWIFGFKKKTCCLASFLWVNYDRIEAPRTANDSKSEFFKAGVLNLWIWASSQASITTTFRKPFRSNWKIRNLVNTNAYWFKAPGDETSASP